MSNEDVVRETETFKQFVKQGRKHITEDQFVTLKNNIISEAWGKNPGSGFSSSMAWVVPKTSAVQRVLNADGYVIHWNAEFEVRFKEWFKQQEAPSSNGTFDKLEFYSTKRKEFTEIYKKEMECYDLGTSS